MVTDERAYDPAAGTAVVANETLATPRRTPSWSRSAPPRERRGARRIAAGAASGSLLRRPTTAKLAAPPSERLRADPRRARGRRRRSPSRRRRDVLALATLSRRSPPTRPGDRDDHARTRPSARRDASAGAPARERDRPPHRRVCSASSSLRRGRPRPARPGARAHDRLARLRRERRRAARRLRRLRPARPAGRHGARARDEGAAPPRRGDRDRGAHRRAAARRRAVRALPGVRRLPLPGSRLRRAARREGAVGRRLAAAARRPRRRRRSSRSSRPSSQFRYRNKMEYSFARADGGPTLGLHRAGRWDEVLEIEKCWLTHRPRQRDPQPHARVGARGEAAAYDQETHEGYLRHLVVREGRNTGQALVQLVTARGERFDRERLIEVLTEFPEVQVDPLVGEPTASPR